MSEDISVSQGVIILQETEAKRVGNWIRELRQRLGLRLEDFARMANIPRDYLIRLEQGKELKVERAVLENLWQAGGI